MPTGFDFTKLKPAHKKAIEDKFNRAYEIQFMRVFGAGSISIAVVWIDQTMGRIESWYQIGPRGGVNYVKPLDLYQD